MEDTSNRDPDARSACGNAYLKCRRSRTDQARFDYAVDVKVSRLNRGVLRIYAIAKELERDSAELGTWIHEMREHL